MQQQRGEAVVTVAIATLWTDPDQVGPQDAPALRVPTDVRGWVAGLRDSGEQGLRGRVATQLLFGERVAVEEVRDGWARVVAVEQPAPRLDPRGYPGWLPVDHIAQVPAPPDPHEPAYLVAATATALRDEPYGDVAMPGVVMGTRLVPAGDPGGGWLPVRAPGRADPLWALQRDLAPEPSGPVDGRQVLRTAERLLDVRYVWGGLSAYGVDCSGLVHLCWRRHGVALPRDADDQARALPAVPLGEERPGDLYLFARPDSRVHHIGLVVPPVEGHRLLLHASGAQGRVVLEPVLGDREKLLVGAVRVPASA